jgi:integrase
MTDDELIARALDVLQRRTQGTAAPVITVAQLIERYEAAKKLTRGWRVTGCNLRAIRDFVYMPGTPPLGQRDVMSLKVLDWTDYRAAKLEEEWAVGRKRLACSVDQQLVSLKAMLRWAVDEGRIPHNPLERAQVRERSRREIAPDEDDITQQLGEADVRMRYVVLASADAGMRRNEIRLCQHDWVDVRGKRIHLSAEACKNQKARTVPATSRLLEAIGAVPRHVRAPWILTNPETEQPFSGNSFSRWFRETADAAGFPKAHLHDNRHAAATRAIASGAKVTAVQRMLGHEHLITTLLYVNQRARDADSDLAQALEAIERGIGDKRR